jgi:hypothetical protein
MNPEAKGSRSRRVVDLVVWHRKATAWTMISRLSSKVHGAAWGGKDGGFHGTVEHVNEVVDRGYAPFSGQHIRVWSCCGIQTATRRRKLGEA